MRVRHALCGADRIAFHQTVDDLGAAGERDAVHRSGLANDDVCTMIDTDKPVNGTAYMDFRDATDELFNPIDHSKLAEALGVSVATIRQARLKPEAKSHRSPPGDWEDAVIRLAEKQVWHYRSLIEEIRSDRRSGKP